MCLLGAGVLDDAATSPYLLLPRVVDRVLVPGEVVRSREDCVAGPVCFECEGW